MQGCDTRWQRCGRWTVAVLAGAAVLTLPTAAGRTQTAQADKTAANAPANWQPAGWGGGGLFWAAVFHPTDPHTLYMGGDVAGVYKTTDDGKSWKLINNGLANYAVYSLAIATDKPDTVWALTTGGLCKTTDGGKNWKLLEQTVKSKLGIVAERNKSVRAVAVDPTNSQIVYAGTPRGKIFRSADGGETWREVYAGSTPAPVYAVAVSPKNSALVLAASGGDGVLVSRDGGQGWSKATGLPNSDAVSVAVSATNAQAVWAAFGKDGVYRSRDGGKTWNRQTVPQMDEKTRPVEIVINPKNDRDVFLLASAGWSGAVFASRDGGETWGKVSRMRPDYAGNPTLAGEKKGDGATYSISKPTNLAISPADPSRLFFAANWRTGFSDDGGKTWTERDNGADISVVYDIRFSNSRVYASAMDEGVLTSADGGKSWQALWPRVYSPTISGHAWRLAVWSGMGTNGSDKILSTNSPWNVPGDRVVASVNGGKTFTESAQGFPAKRPTPNTMWGQGYLRALAPDPNNPQIVYAGIDGDPSTPNANDGGGIFKSTDGGMTWNALPHQPPSRCVFLGLAVDPTNAQRIYWGTCGDKGGLYKSDNGGESWSRVFDRETWIFNVLVTRDGTVYCPGTNLWRSRDKGATWEQISHFTGGEQIVGLETDPERPDTVWLSRVTWGEGAQGGVYKTANGGKTWTDITGDIPYRKPLVLRFNPQTRELWAGGVGLWKTKQ